MLGERSETPKDKTVQPYSYVSIVLPLDEHKGLLQPTREASLHLQTPPGITDTGRGNTVQGEKEEKISSQDSADTTLLVFATAGIYSHTVTHPQHQPQGPSLIDCIAQ